MIDYQLMDHQKDVIWRSQQEPDLYIAWEQGTGKTCATINMLRWRFTEAKRVKRTLILCPAIVVSNWKREFALYSNVPQQMIHTLRGPVKERIEKIKSMKDYSGILVTNYDVMQDQKLVQALMDWGVEILICDEAHILKNYKSKRAKNVELISARCTNRYLLSGTPILNNAMDLFMPYKILDGHLGPQSTFGNNFFVFRSIYFVDANAAWSAKPNYFPKWVPRDSAYPEMMRLLARKTTRITKKECLDLPDLVVQQYDVELSAEQRKLYEEMKDEYITWVNSERNKGIKDAVVARLAITKALRLQQIVSGFVRTDKGEVIRMQSNPRIDALRDLLESLTPSHKVIVWACFKENYVMIRELCEELKIKSVELHGEVSEKEKQLAVKNFEGDSEVRVLIGNQGAGGIGINLVQASYAIYYSRGFKLGDDLQSEARNHRRGSEIHEKITRINLVATNTIDELVAEALQGKLDIAEKILGWSQNL